MAGKKISTKTRIRNEAKQQADAQYGGAISGAKGEIRTNSDTGKEMVRREGLYASILAKAYAKPVASESYDVAKRMVSEAAAEGSNGASAGTQEANANKVNAYNSYLARQYVNSNMALEGQRMAVAARGQDRLAETQRIYRQRGDKLTDELGRLRQQHGSAFAANVSRLTEAQRNRDSAERQAKQAAEAERYKAQLQNQLAMAQLEEERRHNQSSEGTALMNALAAQAKAANGSRPKSPFNNAQQRKISWLGEHQIPFMVGRQGMSLADVQRAALRGIRDGSFTVAQDKDPFSPTFMQNVRTPGRQRFTPDMWAAAIALAKRARPDLIKNAQQGQDYYGPAPRRRPRRR